MGGRPGSLNVSQGGTIVSGGGGLGACKRGQLGGERLVRAKRM